jgi:hypothetical protein
VLGVDLLVTKDVRSTHRLVVAHLEAVRKIPGLQGATAVLQLEYVLKESSPVLDPTELTKAFCFVSQIQPRF